MTRTTIRREVTWGVRLEAIVREHPGLAVACYDCTRSTGGACGRPEHQPIIVERAVGTNLITNAGLNFLRDILETQSPSAGIRYVAWGSDATAPVVADTTLGTEDGRKAVTSFADPAVGAKKTIVYLSPSEANQTLEELGWFASSTATATVDSGIMVARALYPGGAHTKTELESIQLERTDTIS